MNVIRPIYGSAPQLISQLGKSPETRNNPSQGSGTDFMDIDSRQP